MTRRVSASELVMVSPDDDEDMKYERWNGFVLLFPKKKTKGMPVFIPQEKRQNRYPDSYPGSSIRKNITCERIIKARIAMANEISTKRIFSVDV